MIEGAMEVIDCSLCHINILGFYKELAFALYYLWEKFMKQSQQKVKLIIALTVSFGLATFNAITVSFYRPALNST